MRLIKDVSKMKMIIMKNNGSSIFSDSSNEHILIENQGANKNNELVPDYSMDREDNERNKVQDLQGNKNETQNEQEQSITTS